MMCFSCPTVSGSSAARVSTASSMRDWGDEQNWNSARKRSLFYILSWCLNFCFMQEAELQTTGLIAEMRVMDRSDLTCLCFSPQRERLRNIERICCLLRKVNYTVIPYLSIQRLMRNIQSWQLWAQTDVMILYIVVILDPLGALS